MLTVWNKDQTTLLDVQKLRDRKVTINPDVIACQYAELIINHMPGNALDVLLSKMTENIRAMIESGQTEMLLAPYDLENRLRISLNELADEYKIMFDLS